MSGFSKKFFFNETQKFREFLNKTHMKKIIEKLNEVNFFEITWIQVYLNFKKKKLNETQTTWKIHKKKQSTKKSRENFQIQKKNRAKQIRLVESNAKNRKRKTRENYQSLLNYNKIQ